MNSATGYSQARVDLVSAAAGAINIENQIIDNQ